MRGMALTGAGALRKPLGGKSSMPTGGVKQSLAEGMARTSRFSVPKLAAYRYNFADNYRTLWRGKHGS